MKQKRKYYDWPFYGEPMINGAIAGLGVVAGSVLFWVLIAWLFGP